MSGQAQGKRPALISAGGSLVIDQLFGEHWFRALRAEGLALRGNAVEQRKDQPDPGGWRAGNPDRFLASAQSGPVLDRIYADPELAVRLEALAGAALHPTGARGSFSYYDRPGHYLGLHRDIRGCDVTLITCLERVDGAEPSGMLRLYPKSMRSPLQHVARSQSPRDIALRPGQSLLLLGGCIPHEVRPAAPGYRRAISVLCFETHCVSDQDAAASPG
jgi:hypothetical protein